MWAHFTHYLNNRPWCVVTRPFVGVLVVGLLAGTFGLIFIPFGRALFLRMALGGAVAGFIAGLWSGIDRMSWPSDQNGENHANANY